MTKLRTSIYGGKNKKFPPNFPTLSQVHFLLGCAIPPSIVPAANRGLAYSLDVLWLRVLVRPTVFFLHPSLNLECSLVKGSAQGKFQLPQP